MCGHCEAWLIVWNGAAESAEGRLIAQRLELANARAERPVGASCFCAQAAAAE